MSDIIRVSLPFTLVTSLLLGVLASARAELRMANDAGVLAMEQDVL